MRLIDADALIAELEIMPIDIGYEDMDRVMQVIKNQPEAVIKCEKMTKEKALAHLRHYTHGIYMGSMIRIPPYSFHLTKETTDILEEALLKQIKKKYIMDIDTVRCPDCNAVLKKQLMRGESILCHDFYDYCPRCGQAINWSDFNE